jgi:hypothetical protein
MLEEAEKTKEKMMIRSRMGIEIVPKQLASPKDFEKLTGNKPNKIKQEGLKNHSYIIAERSKSGEKRLYHLSQIIADDPHQELYPIIDRWMKEASQIA